MLQSLLGAFNPAAVVVVCLAGIVRGYSGFGFSLAAVPLLSLILPLNMVVPLALALEALGILPALPRLWRHADWPALSLLLFGSILAMPLGVYILHVGAPWLLRPAIAVLVLLAVALIWHPPRLGQDVSTPGSALLAGATSGVLNGAAAMSGPPIIVFMLSSLRSHESMRATMMLFFSASAAVTLAVGLGTGTYAPPHLGLLLWCLPVLALGIEAGILLQRLATPLLARRVALLFLALSATASLVVSIHSL